MEVKAVAKGVRVGPRKARLVIDLIRNKKVEEAEVILKNLNQKASKLIYKVLVSAVANAENNYELEKEKLIVKKAVIDEGKTLKRMRFGSRGHIDPIKKRTSHITIIVSDENK